MSGACEEIDIKADFDFGFDFDIYIFFLYVTQSKLTNKLNTQEEKKLDGF